MVATPMQKQRGSSITMDPNKIIKKMTSPRWRLKPQKEQPEIAEAPTSSTLPTVVSSIHDNKVESLPAAQQAKASTRKKIEPVKTVGTRKSKEPYLRKKPIPNKQSDVVPTQVHFPDGEKPEIMDGPTASLLSANEKLHQASCLATKQTTTLSPSAHSVSSNSFKKFHEMVDRTNTSSSSSPKHGETKLMLKKSSSSLGGEEVTIESFSQIGTDRNLRFRAAMMQKRKQLSSTAPITNTEKKSSTLQLRARSWQELKKTVSTSSASNSEKLKNAESQSNSASCGEEVSIENFTKVVSSATVIEKKTTTPPLKTPQIKSAATPGPKAETKVQIKSPGEKPRQSDTVKTISSPEAESRAPKYTPTLYSRRNKMNQNKILSTKTPSKAPVSTKKAERGGTCETPSAQESPQKVRNMAKPSLKHKLSKVRAVRKPSTVSSIKEEKPLTVKPYNKRSIERDPKLPIHPVTENSVAEKSADVPCEKQTEVPTIDQLDSTQENLLVTDDGVDVVTSAPLKTYQNQNDGMLNSEKVSSATDEIAPTSNEEEGVVSVQASEIQQVNKNSNTMNSSATSNQTDTKKSESLGDNENEKKPHIVQDTTTEALAPSTPKLQAPVNTEAEAALIPSIFSNSSQTSGESSPINENGTTHISEDGINEVLVGSNEGMPQTQETIALVNEQKHFLGEVCRDYPPLNNTEIELPPKAIDDCDKNQDLVEYISSISNSTTEDNISQDDGSGLLAIESADSIDSFGFFVCGDEGVTSDFPANHDESFGSNPLLRGSSLVKTISSMMRRSGASHRCSSVIPKVDMLDIPENLSSNDSILSPTAMQKGDRPNSFLCGVSLANPGPSFEDAHHYDDYNSDPLLSGEETEFEEDEEGCKATLEEQNSPKKISKNEISYVESFGARNTEDPLQRLRSGLSAFSPSFFGEHQNDGGIENSAWDVSRVNSVNKMMSFVFGDQPDVESMDVQQVSGGHNNEALRDLCPGVLSPKKGNLNEEALADNFPSNGDIQLDTSKAAEKQDRRRAYM